MILNVDTLMHYTDAPQGLVACGSLEASRLNEEWPRSRRQPAFGHQRPLVLWSGAVTADSEDDCDYDNDDAAGDDVAAMAGTAAQLESEI